MFFGLFDCDYTQDLPHLWRWAERFVEKQGESPSTLKNLAQEFPKYTLLQNVGVVH
jgi:hypothetical protein